MLEVSISDVSKCSAKQEMSIKNVSIYITGVILITFIISIGLKTLVLSNL